MKPCLDHVTPQQRATRGPLRLVLTCRCLTPAETPRQAMFWAHPRRSRWRTAPSHRSRVEKLARETSSRGGMSGSSPVLASAVAAVLGGRGGLGLGDSGDGARVGGVRPGPGGEGSGEGSGSTSLPTGGYQVKPRYPDSARRRGVEGTVVIRAYITEQGRVEQVRVEQSAGHAYLDEAAVDAVGRWRFEPARRGRQAIAMWVSIPVRFMLNR